MANYSHHNSGRAWHLDRQKFNKNEDWEEPMRSRKLRYKTKRKPQEKKFLGIFETGGSVEKVEWNDVKSDMQYPETDNNNGYIYGVNYLDEDGNVLDSEWFMTEEERENAISMFYRHGGEYASGGGVRDFARGGGVGYTMPNTVAEYREKMNDFSRRLGTAESLWKMDDGKSYKRVIAEQDDYYLKTKDAWYKELSEAEASGNLARYNVLLKMINEAFKYASFKYESGGGVRTRTQKAFGAFDFEQLERIFNVRLFGLDEEQTENTLDELRKEWDSMSETERLEIIEEYGIDIQEYAKGGRAGKRRTKNYNYIPNRMIESVEVKKGRKVTNIDGDNVLDGVYVKGKVKFAGGGHLESDKENQVRSNLVDGRIEMNTLKEIIGCEPNYPNQIVGSIKLEKCFLLPYYRLA